MSRPERHEHHLRPLRVDELLEAHHLTHADAAVQLGYSRSYWSMLVNRHRRLSPSVRRCLRRHPVFATVPEDELWTRALRGGV
ncbi:helix-turn-helix domain-containing protein [Myxococcota bacterium]|nr:helix-turn-helix domain-containing protein [Myxococcota bacterium]